MEMNRRDFFKKLGLACGVAAVCPTKLLKGKPEPELKPNKAQKAIIYDKFGKPMDIPYGIPYWVKLYTRRNPDGKYVFVREIIHPKDFYK